jgi:hypothetical protein
VHRRPVFVSSTICAAPVTSPEVEVVPTVQVDMEIEVLAGAQVDIFRLTGIEAGCSDGHL